MLETVTRIIFSATALLGVVALLAAPAQAIDIGNNGTDGWIISRIPDASFDGTGGSLWDVRRNFEVDLNVDDIRYAFAEYDLSGLFGTTVTSVQMHIDELDLNDDSGVGSSASLPIATEMFVLDLDASDTSLASQTWNTYQAEAEGTKDTVGFSTLGAFDLAAPGQSGGGERFTVGDASDIAMIQTLIDANATLTIVLKPTAADGQGASFGDNDSAFPTFGSFLRINDLTVPPPPPPLPTVPGFTVELYADLNAPNEMSFDAAGNLYVGNGASFDFITRIGPGGSPVVPYGNVGIDDPDSVLVDVAGAISGTPGSVLVGGGVPNPKLSAILPDESVITVLDLPTNTNPVGMQFDSTGRMVYGAGNPIGSVLAVSGGVATLLYDGSPNHTTSIEIGPMDRIYIMWGLSLQLQIHDASGAVIDASFVTGLGAGTQIEFGPGGPWGTDLYALSDGELLRIDDLGNTVVVGTGFETFVNDLEFGPDGALYVSDFLNDRILRIVPEPSTLVLAIAGLLSLGCFASRCPGRA